MGKLRYKHVYGPVSSWRLGRSLGIDPVCVGGVNICSFDCIYCQAGKTTLISDKRKIFVPTKEILEEIKSFPPVEIDYITFSGRGEPTLAKNLGEMIRGIKKEKEGKIGINKGRIRAKIAVITNSSLMESGEVRRDLALADLVIAKLDAHSEALFRKIERPAKTIKLKNIVKGLKDFKKKFKGRFALQLMFMKENKKYAGNIARLARTIGADEIYVNTPTRPCGVKPLSKSEIKKIKSFFKGMKIAGVYDCL